MARDHGIRVVFARCGDSIGKTSSPPNPYRKLFSGSISSSIDFYENRGKRDSLHVQLEPVSKIGSWDITSSVEISKTNWVSFLICGPFMASYSKVRYKLGIVSSDTIPND